MHEDGRRIGHEHVPGVLVERDASLGVELGIGAIDQRIELRVAVALASLNSESQRQMPIHRRGSGCANQIDS